MNKIILTVFLCIFTTGVFINKNAIADNYEVAEIYQVAKATPLPNHVLESLTKKYGGRATSVTNEDGKIRLQILDNGKVTIIYLNSTNYSIIEVKK